MERPSQYTVDPEDWAPLAAAQAENREFPRFPLGCVLRVGWNDKNGGIHAQSVQGVDLCERGLAFLSSERLPLTTRVYIELPNSRVVAKGCVRYCNRKGDSWRVGLQLDDTFVSYT